jgi:hypothetical protein
MGEWARIDLGIEERKAWFPRWVIMLQVLSTNKTQDILEKLKKLCDTFEVKAH